MRISDWSSDVCSSDLLGVLPERGFSPGCRAPSTAQKVRQQRAGVRFKRFRDIDEFDDIQPALTALIFSDEGLRPAEPFGNIHLGEILGLPNTGKQFLQSLLPRRAERFKIGRASCRERVCQYVWISVVAVSLKKKK